MYKVNSNTRKQWSRTVHWISSSLVGWWWPIDEPIDMAFVEFDQQIWYQFFRFLIRDEEQFRWIALTFQEKFQFLTRCTWPRDGNDSFWFQWQIIQMIYFNIIRIFIKQIWSNFLRMGSKCFLILKYWTESSFTSMSPMQSWLKEKNRSILSKKHSDSSGDVYVSCICWPLWSTCKEGTYIPCTNAMTKTHRSEQV